MNTNVAIFRPSDAPSRDITPGVASPTPRARFGLLRLAEVLAAVSRAARGHAGRGAKAWPDGAGGRYLEFALPDGSCPDMDICVHEGRVFVHVKE